MEAADLAAAGEGVEWRLYFAALCRPTEHSRHRVVVRTCIHPVSNRSLLGYRFVFKSPHNIIETQRSPTRSITITIVANLLGVQATSASLPHGTGNKQYFT